MKLAKLSLILDAYAEAVRICGEETMATALQELSTALKQKGALDLRALEMFFDCEP